MISLPKNHILTKRLFAVKNSLFKKLPKLLDNKKLAKRLAKPDPLEVCIKQSKNLVNCEKIIHRKKILRSS